MNHVSQSANTHTKNSSEYNQCIILWRNLPAAFKTRWSRKASELSMTGYKLFIKTNINNLMEGKEIKIAPWH